VICGKASANLQNHCEEWIFINFAFVHLHVMGEELWLLSIENISSNKAASVKRAAIQKKLLVIYDQSGEKNFRFEQNDQVHETE